MASVKTQSSLRTEQAAQTRRRILDAAGRVFEGQGYAGARIEDIAARAGVAVPTVYKIFTNKATLLVGALNQAMAGDGDTAIEQQSWFTEQLDEPDPVRQLQLIARNARRLYERAGQLLSALRSAKPLDADLARAWDAVAAQRLARSRRTAKNLMAKSGSQARLTRDQTTLTLCALTEPELFITFTANGKGADHYEAWLADILCRSTLA
jgi:AcrR family transcriptional regulator